MECADDQRGSGEVPGPIPSQTLERKVILLVVFTRAEFQEILFDAGKYIYSIDYS